MICKPVAAIFILCLSGCGGDLPQETEITDHPKGEICYVDASAMGDETGMDWENAFLHPQPAVDAAREGGQVWVAAGIYRSLSQDDEAVPVLRMKEGVEVLGGFLTGDTAVSQRDYSSNVSVLEGDQLVFHVVSGADRAILDGFTLSGGRAVGEFPDDSGGGMLNLTVSPAIKNCIFSNNYALWHGGAMFNLRSRATVTGCVFSGNTAEYNGAAVYNDSEGSARGKPVISNSVFKGRNYCRFGAGVFNNHCPAVISDCSFENNEANHSGGGICNICSASFISGCTFSGNSAVDDGGGIYINSTAEGGNESPSIENCLFTGNSTYVGGGGGIYVYNSAPVISLCTFNGNSAAYGGAMSCWNSPSRIRDCIMWGDMAGFRDAEIEIGSGFEPLINYSNIDADGYGLFPEGGPDLKGNMRMDPIFAAGPRGNFYLAQLPSGQPIQSPCIDRGSMSSESAGMEEKTTRTDGEGDTGLLDIGYHYAR